MQSGKRVSLGLVGLVDLGLYHLPSIIRQLIVKVTAQAVLSVIKLWLG